MFTKNKLDEVAGDVGMKVNTKFNQVSEKKLWVCNNVKNFKNFEWRKFVDGWFTRRPNGK